MSREGRIPDKSFGRMDLKVFSVVVVGAGVAGLVSARELSKHFADGLLVEAGPNTGGRVQEVGDTPPFRGCLPVAIFVQQFAVTIE